MLIIKDLITKEECSKVIEMLDKIGWERGSSQGQIRRHHKNNLEIPCQCSEELNKFTLEIVNRLLADPIVGQFAYINKLTSPRYNKYCEEDEGFYRIHTDAIEQGNNVRTDYSMTLVLTEPDTYEGGELKVYTGLPGEVRTAKPEAGSIVLYNSGDLHEVTPVTKGARISMIAWVQSFIKDPAKRLLLGRFWNRLHELEGDEKYFMAHKDLANIATHLQKEWADI